MTSDAQATIADLRRVPENGKAEIVNDRVVLIPPHGGLPGYTAGEIRASLHAYARSRKTGYAFGGTVGFIVDLPHRRSFCPDAAYYIGSLSMDFVDGAPLFAVEVRSKGEYGIQAENEMADKRADYFAAGTQVVWDVDLLSADIVRAYRADRPNEPSKFRRDEIADAEPALPGWRLAVNDLFPPA
jgi:Uma2 family endonuclease